MKLSNIKYLFIFAAGLSLHSCLDLEPQDQLGENKMWQTANDYLDFANNFYGWTADFSSVVRAGGYHNDLSSDLMTAASADVISQGNNTQPSSDGVYTGDYAHIRRCNMLLQRAAGYSKPDEIKQYVGEAYFFRAYSYYDLLRTFGNVIITTEPLTIDDPKMQVEQDDRSKVIDLIVSDLNKAIENLPDFKALTSAENGRLSKQAAYDYPIIRYAEVLLNYVEAVFERDGKISDNDLAYLNQVRLRVNQDNGMPALTNAFVSENGLDMRTEIRRERTIELFQEGFRLDDLKRWATAVEEMNKPLLGVKFTGTEFEQKWSGGKPSQPTDADGRLIMDSNRKWTDKNYLFPLPSDQLTLNVNLKQNAGWK